MTDRNLSQPQVKIPNNYKRWQPLTYIPPPDGESPRRSWGLPQDVLLDTHVKVIFRGGQHEKGKADRFFWGDAEYMGVIVGYRVIKLESRGAEGWIAWGQLYDRDIPLDTEDNIPTGLDPTARVEVWCRNHGRPQNQIRQAQHWHWQIVGEGHDDSNEDIMRYRVVRGR